MKKSAKILIAATVISSIVGVGAVSYAAWTASGSTEQGVSGTTGSVRTIGNLTVTPSTASGTLQKMNALYPVDQGTGYLNFWEFTLSAEVPEGEAAPTFMLVGELAAGASGTPVTNAKLYWSATQPTSATVAVPDNELSTAKELSGLSDNTDETGKIVYVYMVATGTDAMKATITLTFSAS